MSAEGDDESGLVLFGHDVTKIPCFRNSFLYGISGGIGSGILYFMFTSKPRMAQHVGFGTFFSVTLVYWFYCRYQWSKQKFAVGQIRSGLQEHQMYEGTEVEARVRAMMKEGK